LRFSFDRLGAPRPAVSQLCGQFAVQECAGDRGREVPPPQTGSEDLSPVTAPLEQLENRALGRPTERVETVSNPIDDALDTMTPEEIRKMLEDFDSLG